MYDCYEVRPAAYPRKGVIALPYPWLTFQRKVSSVKNQKSTNVLTTLRLKKADYYFNLVKGKHSLYTTSQKVNYDETYFLGLPLSLPAYCILRIESLHLLFPSIVATVPYHPHPLKKILCRK